tara:strand:- start:2446 stop:2844 length:399 start_codon:yes stop_codon:yes gene_type:complete
MEAHLRVDIEGKPASRPRFTRNGRAYTAPNYANYLKELSAVLKPLETKQIIAGDWNELEVKFYFCYPKSTPKKNRKVLEYMRYKCDCDNLIKPVMDVMQKLGWIEDDRQIAKLSVAKLQGELEPHIEISLYQ